MNLDSLLALVKKELRLYFNSPIAYIFLIGFLTISMWFFFRGFFLINQAEIRGFFGILPWIFLFLIPALTMRVWAEEYRQGTVEILLTSSISLRTAVLGKFVASLIFLTLALTLTLTLPLSIALIGSLDWGTALVSYVGALLLGTAYLALGLFISSITANQIVAFIVSILITFIFFIIGNSIVTFALPNVMVKLFESISLGNHYVSMLRGVIDTRDVIYYLSFILLFLYLNYRILDARK
ncbi:MAG: ABC transporter permease subunit [Patescibacteria group bacterium]